MGSPLIWIEVEKGGDFAAQVEERARAALTDIEGIEIVSTKIRTPANIDPAALQEVVTMLRGVGDVAGVAATTIGAATLVIGALRKLAEESAALIRTVSVRIGGERRSIEAVTPEELAEEMRRPAAD